MGLQRMMEVVRWKILEYRLHRLCNLPRRAPLLVWMKMRALVPGQGSGLVMLLLVMGMTQARILVKPHWVGLNGWGGKERKR